VIGIRLGQAATGSTAMTWNQQNSTDFNKLWNLVRDQVLYSKILLGSPLDSIAVFSAGIETC
jgi:hypothetical protein